MKTTPQNLFHVTHAKAGSTWIANILQDVFGRRVAKRFGGNTSEYQWRPGQIYPAVFLGYQDFLKLEGAAGAPVFYVIRDIRDTLVSLYFSMRYSHTTRNNPRISAFRTRVESMSDAEGIQETFKGSGPGMARKQKSWLQSGELVVRYEDLMADKGYGLAAVFTQLGVEYDEKKLDKALEKHWFENKFGRKLGQKNKDSHGRQGLPGDWRNYMTPELSDFINSELSQIIVDSGYES